MADVTRLTLALCLLPVVALAADLSGPARAIDGDTIMGAQ